MGFVENSFFYASCKARCFQYSSFSEWIFDRGGDVSPVSMAKFGGCLRVDQFDYDRRAQALGD